jgi:hypothetical protein
MTDILAALNFGFGFGWLALIVLLLIHLNRRLRFDHHEWTAVKLLIAIGIPSALERIVLGLITTPTRLLVANDLPTWAYVVPIMSRFLGALAVWVAVGWTLVIFWPGLMRKK